MEKSLRGKKVNNGPWRDGVQKVRRMAAEERQAERDKRTPQQQLELLDKKLGVGVGAKKERAKLQALIVKA